MKTVAIIIFACLFFSDFAKAEPAYTIGVGDYDYFPHHGIKNGEYAGYARDVLDMFAFQCNLKITYIPLPWKRLVVNFLREKKLDFVFPDNPVWDTEAKKNVTVHYSDAVVEYTDGVAVLNENKGKGLGFIKNLGTIRGFTAWDYHEQIDSGQIKLYENKDFMPLMRMIVLNRIQGAYIEKSVMGYYARQMGLENTLNFDESLPHTTDHYYLSTLKHPEIIKKFNAFQLKNATEIRLLKKKHHIYTSR
jgi:hypothetical protein